MDILTSIRCLFYCFVYGFIFTGLYHIINRMTYRLWLILKLGVQVILGVLFSYCFMLGLIDLNDGVLRIYLFLFVFLGYVFFQRYYSFLLLCCLEKYAKISRRIIRPFIFFFKKINVIIKKRVKWVKKKWQKRKSSNSKN